MRNNPQRLFLVIFTALVVLAVLSVCPWSKWTNGHLKDFNLLGDVMPQSPVDEELTEANIDPALLEFVDNEPSDTVRLVEPSIDTLTAVSLSDLSAPRLDGVVLIEDYSADQGALKRIATKLSEADGRKVRIAFVGDSYIEGDIMTQDIRASLQDRYGGSGVGYVGAFSQFPGFRQSVIQTSANWKEHEIRNMKNDPMRTILGHYHVAEVNPSKTSFKGTTKVMHADSWDNTMIMFVAPSPGTITFTSTDNTSETINVEASDDLQCLTLNTSTTNISITSDIAGLKVLGIWLEGNSGIVLDNISLRGNSGISHRSLSEPMTSTMRQWVDYDLIVLEFGMNVLSAKQTDYTAYAKGMKEVVNYLKSLYPNAMVLIMGVGDRGTKMGTQYVSMPTTQALVRAQRNIARSTGSMFYDTREAMGGEGASVEWHSRKLVNSDYVHLNHKGGKELADIFTQSLYKSLQ